MDSLFYIILASSISLWFSIPAYGLADDLLSGDISLEEADQESKAILFAQATKAKPITQQKRPVTRPRVYKAPPKPTKESSFFSWFDEPETLYGTQKISKSSNKLSLNLFAEQIGPGIGLEYGYKFSQFLIFSSGLSTNTAQLDGQQKNNLQESIRASTQSVFGFIDYQKQTWLFPSVGFSLRTSNGAYGWRGPENYGSFSANILTLESRISSEWSFLDKFHFGAHWVGVGYPIFGSITVESTDGLEDLTKFNTSKSPKDRIYQELKSQILLNYLTFYGGLSF